MADGSGDAAGLLDWCGGCASSKPAEEPFSPNTPSHAPEHSCSDSRPQIRGHARTGTKLTWQHAGLVYSESQAPGRASSHSRAACGQPCRASPALFSPSDSPADACQSPSLVVAVQQQPDSCFSSQSSEVCAFGRRPAKRARCHASSMASAHPSGPSCAGLRLPGGAAPDAQPERTGCRRSSSAQEMAHARPSDDGMLSSPGAAAACSSAKSELARDAEALAEREEDSRQPHHYHSQPFTSTGQPSQEDGGDGVTLPQSSCQHSADAAVCRQGDDCNGASSCAQLPAQAASHEGKQRSSKDSSEPVQGSAPARCHTLDAQPSTASGSPCSKQGAILDAVHTSAEGGAAGLLSAAGAGDEYVDLTLIDPGKQARLLAAIQREAAGAASSRAGSQPSPLHCRQSGLMKQAKMQAFFSLK